MGPLQGLRIIEIAGIGPGPFCAMLLADLGAEVLRIERPVARDIGVNLDSGFPVLHRGRKAITLDLKQPGCVDTVLDLCATADALIEGNRPGVMEKLGLSPEACMACNPKLVYGRVTGWGQTGPYAELAGHDINYIAIAGALFHSGGTEKPAPAINLVGDFGGGGMLLAVGVLSALWEAAQSGKGQVVDAAMVDGAASLMGMVYGFKALGQWKGERNANLLDGGSHKYNVYETADGRFLAVGCLEARFYQDFLRRLGIPPGAMDDGMNPEKWPAYRKRLAEIFRSRNRREWEEVFRGSDACVTPVLDVDEAPNDPHLRARGTFTTLDGVVQPAPAPRFSRTPAEVSPGRRLDRDSAAILQEWGVSESRIQSLRAIGETV